MISSHKRVILSLAFKGDMYLLSLNRDRVSSSENKALVPCPNIEFIAHDTLHIILARTSQAFPAGPHLLDFMLYPNCHRKLGENPQFLEMGSFLREKLIHRTSRSACIASSGESRDL